MIGLAATTYDPEGALLLDEVPANTRLGTVTRRVNRRPTLDGGAAFEDRGSTVADREIRLELVPRADLRATLERLVTTYRWLLVATREGVFLAAPASAELGNDRFRINLLVAEKRSA